MEKFIYNDDVLTVETSTCETSPYYFISLVDQSGKTVFHNAYNTDGDEHEARELAKADYCKVRENRTVNDILAEFESKNHFCGFSDDELTTLAWAFTHPGFELIYPVLYKSLNKEILMQENLG